MRGDTLSRSFRSARVSLAISFTVVLLIPVLLSSFVFWKNYQTSCEQLDQVSFTTNRQMVTMVDAYLKETQSAAYSFLLNEYAEAFKNYATVEPTPRQVLLLRDLQKEMKAKVTTSGYIKSIYAIFPRSDVILSDYGVFYDHNFRYRCRDSLGMTLEQWDEFLCFEGNRRVALVESTIDGKKRILSAQKGGPTVGNMDMILLTELDVSVFENILNSLSQNDGALAVICDSSTGVALAAAQTEKPEQPAYQLENGKITAESAFVTVSDSEYGSWSCMLITPKEAYRMAMRPLLFSIGLYLAVCLSIGLLLVYYFSRKQSAPIEKISSQLLATIEQGKPAAGKSEYEQIQEAIVQLLRQRTTMQEESSVMRKGFQTSILHDILLGRSDDRILHHARNNGLALEGECFLVVLYDITEFGRVFSRIDNSGDNEELFDVVLDVIVSATEQDSGIGKYTRFAAEMDGSVACIVCCPDSISPARFAEDMLQNTETVRDFLKEKFDLLLSAAVSSPCGDIADISRCYREADETMEYMETMGIVNCTYRYEQISEISPGSSFSWEKQMEKKWEFCNCMRAGAYETCRKLLEEMIDGFNLDKCSAAEARLRTLDMLSVVGPVTTKALAEQENAPQLALSPEVLIETKNASALCMQCFQAIDHLIDSADRQKRTRSSQQREQLTSYIGEYLTDPNLNMNMAAEAFGMSPSYFSRTFRKLVGTGFLDYVQQRRVDLAKELMRLSPGIQLKDIAVKVGYSTPLALNRAFRKTEGIAPSLYRESIGR